MSDPRTVVLEEIPAHVPKDLVYNFDFLSDPELSTDPHGRIAQIVKEAPPIFFSPCNGGQWVLAGHKAVFSAVRTPEMFSSTPAEVDGVLPPQLLPLMVDPPVHSSYRLPLNVAFGPQVMAKLEGPIRELTRSLIAKVKEQGHCEFVNAVAEPVPVLTFLQLMGMPGERLAEFRTVIKKMATGEGFEMLGQIALIMMEYIEARKHEPEDDLISKLWKLEIDGRPITDEEMLNFGILLFIAGLDTVINEMAFTMRYFAAHPELQAELRAEPSRIPIAIEESLRCHGIVMPPRLVVRDGEFEGVTFRKGDRVLLLLPAANLDPDAFEDPLTFELDRPSRSHLTFNAGPHRCVGMHLARIEMRIVFEEWFKAVPECKLDPGNPPRYRPGNILTVDTLDLVW